MIYVLSTYWTKGMWYKNHPRRIILCHMVHEREVAYRMTTLLFNIDTDICALSVCGATILLAAYFIV